MVKKSKTMTTETDTTKNVEQLLESIDKYLDSPEAVGEPPWYLDTGNFALNWIISGDLHGGWPAGLITEVFGENSTGKTLLIMKAVSSVQKLGGIAIVADVERRWNDQFATSHGVDIKALKRFYPDSVEEFSTQMMELLKTLEGSELPILFALDSIAALSTEWEIKENATKEDMGKKAKKIKALMRVLPGKIYKLKAVFLASNHVIANPSLSFAPKMPAGGSGFAFHSSVRVELHKATLIELEGKSRPIGTELTCKITKNSIQPPFGESTLSVTWAHGVDQLSGLLDIMVDLGIVTHKEKSAWYEYAGSSFHASDIEAVIAQHPEILEDAAWKRPYFK